MIVDPTPKLLVIVCFALDKISPDGVAKALERNDSVNKNNKNLLLLMAEIKSRVIFFKFNFDIIFLQKILPNFFNFIFIENFSHFE